METTSSDNRRKISISGPVLGEEKEIASIRKETWLDTYPNEQYGITREDILSKDFDSEMKLQESRGMIKSSGKGSNYIRIAKDGGKIIGFSSGIKRENFNELTAFYILPSYQGQGTGKMLAKLILEWLGEDKKIVVNVVEYNEKAKFFYKKLGFIKTGKPVSYMELPSGKKIPEIEMEIRPLKNGAAENF
jgi:ribosomal protein S18 acetylase RimI-like enzyme